MYIDIYMVSSLELGYVTDEKNETDRPVSYSS